MRMSLLLTYVSLSLTNRTMRSTVSTPFVYRPRSYPALPVPMSPNTEVMHPSTFQSKEWSLHQTVIKSKKAHGDDINIAVSRVCIERIRGESSSYFAAIPSGFACLFHDRRDTLSSFPNVVSHLVGCILTIRPCSIACIVHPIRP